MQPLGAVEQHGPHLPFNTDLLIADRVATAAVERVGAELDVWLLPPLAYTKSNEHAWSAGTIWLSATTLLAVLDDIGRCVATTAARRLVFFNGHGGNSALVGVANREIRLAHGLMTFLAHPGVPPDQGARRRRASSAWASTVGPTRRRSCCTWPRNWSTCPRRRATCPRPSRTTATCDSAAPSASGGCRTISVPTATSATRRQHGRTRGRTVRRCRRRLL